MTATDSEIDAGLKEFYHERSKLGDGCPACGHARWNDPIHQTNNASFHRDLVKRILEAAKPTPQREEYPQIPIRKPPLKLDIQKPDIHGSG